VLVERMDDLGVLKENRDRSAGEFVATVETGDFEDEEVADNLALELGDKVGGSLGRATFVIVSMRTSIFFFTACR
jgi:hypothetical protein